MSTQRGRTIVRPRWVDMWNSQITRPFYMQLSWDLLQSIARMKELAILKIWNHWSVGKYWNRKHTIQFEPHTFHIFCILAHPSAFTSAWLNIEIPVTLFLMPCRKEIPHFTHHKFNTGIYNKLPTQHGRTIASTRCKFVHHRHNTTHLKTNFNHLLLEAVSNRNVPAIERTDRTTSLLN